MVDLTPSDIVDTSKQQIRSIRRRQQEAEEMQVQKSTNRTDLNGQLGDMERYVIKGLSL